MKKCLKSLFYTNSWVRRLHYLMVSNRNTYIEKYSELLGDMDIHKVKRKMLVCLLKYGCVYDEFFCYGLHTKKVNECAAFVTDCKRYGYYKKFNSKSDDILLDNKWDTYKRFSTYYRRDAICIHSLEDFDKFADFIKRHKNEVVIKKLSLSCGKGIRFYNNLDSENLIRSVFVDSISDGPCIVEETIIQSDVMMNLNSSSVNTIRINTILSTNGSDVVLFYPFLKIGQGGMRVDNAGAGGIICSINSKNGMISSDGIDEAGKKYIQHPDTGVVFRGYILPDWSEAIRLARELQKELPNHRCTGWDFAHTNEGWCLVEGNSGGQFVGQQMPEQTGRRKELESLI